MKEEYRNLIALHTNPAIPMSLCNILKVNPNEIDLKYVANLRTLASIFKLHLDEMPLHREQEARSELLGFLTEIQEKLLSITNGDKGLPLDTLFTMAICTVKAKILQIDRVVNGFKKIYKAVYAGETSFFKEADFLAGKENYSNDRLYNLLWKDDSARTKFALALAVKYYDSDSMLTDDIFNEIYGYAFENSGTLKKSNLTGVSIFKVSTLKNYIPLIINESYVMEHPSSRTAKIINALR